MRKAILAALVVLAALAPPVGADPVPLALEGATAVSSGWAHTCAVAGGELACWGDNATAQLGDGTAGHGRPAAMPVTALSGVRMVSAGQDHTCALGGTGIASCWGANQAGQVGGAGLGVLQLTPRVVTRHTGAAITFSDVDAGASHTCGVDTAGQAWCWGGDSDGQLGHHEPYGFGRIAPVRSGAGMGAVRQVSAGDAHTCAVDTAGRAWCWGDNEYGQLGDGTTAPRATPVRVVLADGSALSGVQAISAGGTHTCASTAAGVHCWGDDGFGQIGDGPGGETAVHPVRVTAPGFTGDRVSAGGEHTCAWSGASGKAWCWGRRLHGQIGDGAPATGFYESPVAVAPTTLLGDAVGPIVAISAGDSHTCAVAAERTHCWGLNALGQVGDLTVVTQLRPSTVREVDA